MPKKLVTVRIKSLTVDTNGNFPDEGFAQDADHGLKNNSLMASLKYPRSGAPNVLAVKQYHLVNHVPANLIDDQHPDQFFDPLLFREEVVGHTNLHLGLTKLDATGKGAKILLNVLAVVLGAAFGVVTGGLGKVLGAVVGLGVDGITSAIKKAGDNNDILIGAIDIPLDVDKLSEQEVELPLALKAPQAVIRQRLVVNAANQPVPTDVEILAKDQPNGSIILLVSATTA